MKKKEESIRFLTGIKFSTNHYLANLLALKKIVGIPLHQARELCTLKVGHYHTFEPIEIKSKLSTDGLSYELDKYEISITVTNQ